MLTIVMMVMMPDGKSTLAEMSASTNCSQPLGLEDGRVTDSQITASSSYQETLVGPEKARLNTEIGGGAWCPRNVIDLDHTLEEYLEVDLGEDTFITSVVVQGRYANGLGQEYTEFYVLRYWSESDQDWIEYREKGKSLIVGNNNTYQASEHHIVGSPVIASKVRILPFSYHPRTVCLRLELKGCSFSNESFLLNASNTNYGPDSSTFEDEEWSEKIFLALAIGILVMVIIIAISAVIFVIASSWRLKYYSTFYAYNNDNNSSIESSLKRGDELVQADIHSIYVRNSNFGSEKGSERSDNYLKLQYYPQSGVK